MSWFYGILAIMGWAFAALVLIVFMVALLRARKARARRFDVELIRNDEKQH